MKHPYLFFKVILILSGFFAGAQTPDAAGIVYVTPDGTGNGSSWSSPTSNLHNAINATGAKKVFVATGTYKVGSTSFVMKNGVEIYGGFKPGSGITDLSHNRILPNKGMGDGSILDGENTRPVIWNDMPERGRADMDYTAVLDGFTIMKGRYSSHGAGIRNVNASPTLRNLVIKNNNCYYPGQGAGIYNYRSSPGISDVTITKNNSSLNGGGIYNDIASSPVLTRVSIIDNEASYQGGGIYNDMDCNPVYLNVIVAKNTANGATTAGGGIFHAYGTSTFTNATFVNNTPLDVNLLGGTILFNNAIVPGGLRRGAAAAYTAKNSLLKGNTDLSNGNINAADYTLTDIFTNAGSGDYSLKDGSPAVDGGSNTLYPNLDANTKDLAGSPRVHNYASSGVIDMGAYESPYKGVIILTPDANGIIYVTINGTYNGSSWEHPTSDLHNAIHARGVKKVFVAGGTYKVGAHSFIMKNGVEIYGGFDPDRGIRDLSHNRILPNTGASGGSVLDGEGARSVIWNDFDEAHALDNSAVLDGFSIINGSYQGGHGGGINNTYASPVLRNLAIRNNSAERGGGIANTHSSPAITQTIIASNRAGNYGYGGGVYNTTGSSPQFINCLITNNETYQPSTFQTFGGGMWTTGDSHALLINVTITKNRVLGNSISAGGGFGVADGSSATLYNCIIWGNEKSQSTTRETADIAAWGPLTIRHSLLQVHSTGNDADQNLVGVDPLFTNFAGNDFSLQAASPAINKGSNALFPGLDGSNRDLAGNARVYNYTSGGVIDAGAYESPFNGAVSPDPGGIVYVREGFTGNGQTWETATGDLKKAIEANGTKMVFVATGNYDAPSNGSFKMKNNVEIYGGFQPDNGIRTLADARILPTESISGSVLNGQNQLGVIRNIYTSNDPLDNSAVLDGFTIMNGETPGNTFGAGMLNVYASPVLRNLVIKNNKNPDGGGAGMANVNASPLMNNVIITGNEALRGAGMYNTDHSAPVLTDVIISHNRATSDSQLGGGGIFSQQSSLTLTRVAISHNAAGNAGGGIYLVKDSQIQVNNSVIEGNTALYGGGAYNNGSTARFNEVIFRGNQATMATAGSGGGALFNQNSGLFLTNVAVVGNSTNFQGGGLRNLSGNPELINVTFAGNTAAHAASTALDIAGGTPDFRNTLVLGTVTGSYTARHSLIQGNTNLTNGNLDASGVTPENVFTDPANGNYTLLDCSPAVNSGDNALFPGLDISKVDLAGNARVYDFGNGKVIDMGAYEFQGTPTDYSVILLEDSTVVYDGHPHSITAQNILQGASVTYEITGPDNQTHTGNAATPAGTYVVTATIARGGNCLPIKRTATLKIRKATAVITAAHTQKHVYDGTVKKVVATLNHTETPVNYSPQQGYTDEGTYPIIISASETANYLAASDTVSLVIEKARLSGIALRDSAFTYDGTPKSLAVTGLPAGATVVYTGNAQTHAGIYSVKATVSRPNYRDSLLTATLTIHKAAAVVTAAQTQTHVYDGAVKNIAATLNHTETALIYFPQQSYTAAGTYPVIISAAETGNYFGTADTVSLVIEKAKLSGIALRDSAFTYDGTAKSLAVTGLPAGATVVYDDNGKINAGIYSVKATVSRPNYEDFLLTATLTIGKAAAVITAAQTQKHVYDGAVKNVTATLNHTEAPLTYSPQWGYTTVGTYPIIISAAATANYLAASDTVDLVIEKANLSGITFRDSVFTYDGTPKSLAVAGLSADASVIYSGNEKTLAGIYIVKATVSRPNYEDFLLTANLIINKASARITATQIQKHVYDGTVKNVTAALNHTETTLTYSPQQGYTAAGIYPVIISAAETVNYLKTADTVSLVIEKAALSGITFRDSTFTYDGTPKSLAVDGLPAGATVVYTGNGKINAGTYSVTATVSQPQYQDYTLSATLKINKAAAVITAAQTQKYSYDGTVKNVVASLNHTEAALTYSPQQGYSDAGTYTVTISAAAGTNYLAASATVNLVIESGSISGIILNNLTVTYDGTPKSLIVNGLPAGATVTYGGNGKTDAGVYPVTATVSRPNYQDVLLSATLTINKAAAVITAAAEQAYTADGTVKKVVATLNHTEAFLSYSPQQGYAQSGNYEITVSVPATKNYLAASKKVKLIISKLSFQGVGFSNGEFTYNGAPQFIYVWGAPEGSRITYSGNGQTNAGIYSVKALIQKENYNDLELTATLIIHKAAAYISTESFQSHVYDGSVKWVQAGLNHSETSLAYYPQQGYTEAGSYSVTVTANETPNFSSASATVFLYIDKARFQGVSLADKEFTYNGSPYSLAVTGAPEGAQITYTGNNQTNAGTYKVTALVQMKNYYDLELTAGLVIHKAPQSITFEEIGTKHLENDTDFQLNATSSSGLPVRYTFTYQAEEAPATVSGAGWVELHTSGYVSISAHQEGNENYLPADSVMRQLKIISSDATIHRITINGKVTETPETDIYYLIDCSDESSRIPVQLKTEVGANLVPGRSFIIDVPKPGIYKQTVVITSQDSTNTLTYHITVEKRFKFEDIGIQKFNNLFLVNNNPQTNGGYGFTDYEWYKNGEKVSTGQYYSAGNQAGDLLDEGAEYTVRMKTATGEWLSSCSFRFLPDVTFTLGVFPNPVVAGHLLKVKVNDPGEARVRVLTLTGAPVLEVRVKESPAEIRLPAEISPGTYILHYESGRNRKSIPFVIKK
ncbi:MAG: T9SS type A sorting domain-containing protein [Leadbetterella sp.]|nr:T9SS type A sorting domain-containing protein [Leadbetterella sp.]